MSGSLVTSGGVVDPCRKHVKCTAEAIRSAAAAAGKCCSAALPERGLATQIAGDCAYCQAMAPHCFKMPVNVESTADLPIGAASHCLSLTGTFPMTTRLGC
jgi:hypothetical protein